MTPYCISVSKYIACTNFCSCHRLHKYFYNENFQIYGIIFYLGRRLYQLYTLHVFFFLMDDDKFTRLTVLKRFKEYPLIIYYSSALIIIIIYTIINTKIYTQCEFSAKPQRIVKFQPLHAS